MLINVYIKYGEMVENRSCFVFGELPISGFYRAQGITNKIMKYVIACHKICIIIYLHILVFECVLLQAKYWKSSEMEPIVYVFILCIKIQAK